MCKVFAVVLIAVIFIAAVCIAPVFSDSAVADASSSDAAAKATVNEIHTLNPAQLDHYGYQIGLPLLAPNVGPLTNLYAAALPPRSMIGKSNPVVIRGPYSDLFVGESSLGIVAQ